MKKIAVIVILLVLVVLTGTMAYVLEDTHRLSRNESGFLYLPDGRYMKYASLGFRNPAADILYLWSIQYYGNPEIDRNFRQLEHLYDVITDLDPRYKDAYYIGALIMSIDAHDTEMAIRLLEKGMRNNPEEWFLAVEAGFYCYYNKEYLRAARYFEKAGDMNGGSVVRRLYAAMFEKGGEFEAALETWRDVYEESEEESVKKTAARHIFDLEIKRDLRNINRAVSQFETHYRRKPDSMRELVNRGYLKFLPLDPYGDPYIYNRETGKAESGAEFKYSQ